MVERTKTHRIMTTIYHPAASAADLTQQESHVVHSTHVLLKTVFAIVPIVAGVDKFTNFLAHWENYLNPLALRIVPVSATTLMHIVGVIEIIAGLLVLVKPRLGGFVVMAWLLAIAGQLIVGGMFLDIAVRDIVMALTGALTLARLAPFSGHEPRTTA